jgi:excisionase family DNA binding protein
VSDRAEIDALREALRPLVAELVAEEVERVRDTYTRPTDEEPPYLTVAEYAKRQRTSTAAVRARIRRGKLEAIRPPGGREYLIPNDHQAARNGG